MILWYSIKTILIVYHKIISSVILCYWLIILLIEYHIITKEIIHTGPENFYYCSNNFNGISWYQIKCDIVILLKPFEIISQNYIQCDIVILAHNSFDRISLSYIRNYIYLPKNFYNALRIKIEHYNVISNVMLWYSIRTILIKYHNIASIMIMWNWLIILLEIITILNYHKRKYIHWPWNFLLLL